MGIFSDEDINEAEKIVADKYYKVKFLKGFEAGYYQLKSEPDTQIGWVLTSYLGCLERINEKKLEDDVWEFSCAFGFLIGTMKYKPQSFLDQDPKLIIYVVKHLESMDDKRYYHFVEKRFKRWRKNIEKILSSLRKEQVDNYLYIVRSV